MTQSNPDRIQDIYLDAVELPESERGTFVEEQCAADPDCIREVSSLLEAGARPGILDSPVANFGLPVSLLGKTIDDRYKIERELPHGGMSEVYVARDSKLNDKPVVIKILSAALLENSYARQHFDQEVEAMLRIKNSGIVDVSDRGELSDGRPYIAMQYIDGETLRSQIKNEGMDLRRAASILKQVGAALEHIHQNGVFHRDVKPENIMLSPGTDSVVLIDFGIARVMDSVVALSTVDGASAGTLAYMSPEQLRAEKVAAGSDIYSMAVVAYEMITGRRPFSPNSQAQLLHLQREGVRAKPTDLRRGLSQRAQRILLRALSFEPRHRYKSAEQFGDELAGALNELSGPIDSQPQTIPKWLKVVGGIAIVAVLAYLIYTFIPPPTPLQVRGFNYWLTVQRTRNGKDYETPYKSNGNDTFDNGDKFQLNVQSLDSGYLYIFNERPPEEGSSSFRLIYPKQAISNGSTSVGANHTIQSDWITFEGPAGTDNYWIVWSASQLTELESAKSEALKHPQAGLTAQNLVNVKEYLKKLDTEVDARASRMSGSQEVQVRKRHDIVLTFAEFKHR